MERRNLALLCAGVLCFWLFALAFGTAEGRGVAVQAELPTAAPAAVEDVPVVDAAAPPPPARFQALSAREKDLQLQAERILNTVAQPRLGEGRLVCQAVETQEDGSVVLNYACLLGGSQVQLWDEGWLAKFVFEGTNLSSFVICLRTYTKTEQTSQALPVRQAAAALSAMGQQGKDLQLSYLDNGSTDMLTTQWTVRERT